MASMPIQGLRPGPSEHRLRLFCAVLISIRYYAQGGTDPAGAVYFKFVPGVTDPQPSQTDAGRAATDLGNAQPAGVHSGEPLPQTYGQAPWGQQQAGNPDIRQGNQSPVTHQAQPAATYGAQGYLNGYEQDPASPVSQYQQQQFSTLPPRESGARPLGPGGIPV
jgi:hypothetical protein